MQESLLAREPGKRQVFFGVPCLRILLHQNVAVIDGRTGGAIAQAGVDDFESRVRPEGYLSPLFQTVKPPSLEEAPLYARSERALAFRGDVILMSPTRSAAEPLTPLICHKCEAQQKRLPTTLEESKVRKGA
jgi:hypothetical protein